MPNSCKVFGLFSTEKRFKEIVTWNMDKFIDYTNFDTLAPHLRAVDLLTDEELQRLVGPTGGIKLSKERSKYFYMEVINTKGTKAYTILRLCLQQAKEHMGHKDLVDLLNQALPIEESV